MTEFHCTTTWTYQRVIKDTSWPYPTRKPVIAIEGDVELEIVADMDGGTLFGFDIRKIGNRYEGECHDLPMSDPVVAIMRNDMMCDEALGDHIQQLHDEARAYMADDDADYRRGLRSAAA